MVGPRPASPLESFLIINWQNSIDSIACLILYPLLEPCHVVCSTFPTSGWWVVSFLVFISDLGHSSSNRTRWKWPASPKLLLQYATEAFACSIVVCSAPILPWGDIPKLICWPPEEKYNAGGICPSEVRGRPANISTEFLVQPNFTTMRNNKYMLFKATELLFFFGSRVGLGRKRVCYTAVANWYINGLSVKHQ